MFRFFIPLVILGFGVMLFFQYIQPTQTKITGLKGDIVTLEDATANTKQNIEQKITELKEKDDTIKKDDKDKLNRLVPKREDFDLPAFINDMNNVALQNNQPLRNLSVSGDPTKDSAVGGYGEVTVAFSIETTYDDFRKFIKGIEISDRIFDITSVTFSAPDAKTGKSVYSVSLITYFAS